MEPTAALPRSFSILSPAPAPAPHLDGSGQADNVLPFISRILMEDEDDNFNEFLYQQYLEHNPAFLHTQQLFSQALLPDTSSSHAALAAQPPCNNSIVELQPTTMHSSAPAAYRHFSDDIDTPVVVASAVRSSGAQVNNGIQDAVSMAFFRGMEEANKFLPGDGSTASDRRRRGRKNRLEDAAGDAEGRSSKQMAAADGEESEEYSATREMLDQLMLTGDVDDDPASSLAEDMQELRAAMDIAKKTRPQPLGRPAAGSRADPDRQKKQNTVDLHSMLIRCADAVASNDRRGAADLLHRIRRHASPSGDATQRLAHCFAEGLEVRLNGSTAASPTILQQHCRPWPSPSPSPSVVHQQLKARQLFMASCCFLPVTILFSNRTILDACAGRRKLHVVHYGLDHGLQWAALLRWLARRDGGPPAVRLTGIDAPRPGFRPAHLIEEAGRRLAALARRFGVPFTFRAVAARSESVRAGDLDIDPDEVLAVSSLFHFSTLTDENTISSMVAGDGGSDGTEEDPINVVLGAVREMRPAVFVHAVLNASYSTAFFATRFREALYNFTALFDMMDTVLPRDHGGRMGFERDVLARWAVNAVACEGADRVQRPRSYKQWQARSERAGLRQLPLDRAVVQTVRDKVRKEYHKCFVISEDQRWLLQGWKGRVLYAVSTWTTADG